MFFISKYGVIYNIFEENHMKKLTKYSGAILTTFLLLGCKELKDQTDDPNDNPAETEKEREKEKEPIVSPQEFYCYINNFDTSSRYKRAQITYTIKETSEGTTDVELNNDGQFPENGIESTLVIEATPDKYGNLTVFNVKSENNIQTSTSSFLKESTPLTIRDWEAYHNECRLKGNSNDYIFEEKLYINPCITYMNEIFPHVKDNLKNYSYDQQQSRRFNDEGLASIIYINKSYYYYENDNIVGKYEISCDGKIEYFDKDTSYISLDDLSDTVKSIEYPEFTKQNIKYTIRECLVGDTPTSYYNSGGSLPDGTFNYAKVDAEQDSKANFKSTVPDSPKLGYLARYCATGARTMYLGGWLSFHKQRRDAMNRAELGEGDGIDETLYQNSYKTWMKTKGHRPANSDVDGYFYQFEEYDRRFDENGLVTYEYIVDYYEIDGIFKKWDREPKYYKGIYIVTSEAYFTYE